MPKKDGSPTVAEKRAARKASGTVRPGSVADNRAKAQEQAQTMLQYKVENNINKAKTREKEQRQLPARQQREGSVANKRINNNQPQNNQSQSAATGPTNAEVFDSSALAYMLKTGPTQAGFVRTAGQHNPDYFKNNIAGMEGLNNTEKMSSEGLYQDKYHGPSNAEAWTKYAYGGDVGEAESGVDGVAGFYDPSDKEPVYNKDGGFNFKKVLNPDGSKKADFIGFYDKAKLYMDKGGYAGDVLKQIDNTPGEKDRLSSPDQIAWYNSVVKKAQDFDWSTTYGEGKRGHDPRGLEYGGTAHDGRTTGGGHTSLNTYTPTTYGAGGSVLTPSSNTHDPSNDYTYTPQPKPSSSTAGSSTPGGEQIHYSGHSEPENDSLSNSSLGYQDWESQMATAQSNMNNINPYSTRPGKTKASNMNFTFDPYKY